MGHVVGRERPVAVLLEGRDGTARGVPGERVALGVVGAARVDAAQRVGHEEVRAVREALLELGLQRVVVGGAVVLVEALQVVAVLRVGQEGLRHRRRAARHLLDPARVRQRHAVERRHARLELVVQLVAEREVLRVDGVQRLVARGHALAVAAHVGEAEGEALGDLAVDRQVPLLRARPLVAVEGAVHQARAVAEVRADERRRGVVLGEAVLDVERGLGAVEAAAEAHVAVEAVLAHAGAPAGDEGPVVEDAPPGADEGLVVDRVGEAEARGQAPVPVLLGVARAVARLAPAVARVGQACRGGRRPTG